MSVSIELVERNTITFWTVTDFNYLSQTLHYSINFFHKQYYWFV